ETVVDRPHHPAPVGPHPIANREQVGLAIDIEREMLHHARRDRRRRPCGMRYALLRLDFADFGRLHKSDRATLTEIYETVKSVVDAVHPIECDQLATHRLGEELDLLLDILGANREMMYAVRQTHEPYPPCATRARLARDSSAIAQY